METKLKSNEYWGRNFGGTYREHPAKGETKPQGFILKAMQWGCGPSGNQKKLWRGLFPRKHK